MSKTLIYHGSSQIVETPEIRIAKFNKDLFHCEPIEKVADDFIEKDHITNGEYDNISACRYLVPDYWDIGEVFARLIEDCCGKKDVIEGLKEVYASWLTEEIMNFNSDLYYQSRDYIAECYRAGEILLG